MKSAFAHFRRIAMVCLAMAFAAPFATAKPAFAAVGDAKREVERIADQLERLQEQAQKLAADWEDAQQELVVVNQDIVKAEASVQAKEAELNKLQGDLAEVALRSFTDSGSDALGPLFTTADDYDNELRRDQYSRVALEVGNVSADDLDELIASLDREKQALENKRAHVTALNERITNRQAETEQLTARYEQLETQAQQRYANELAAEQQRRVEAANRRWQQQQAAAAAAAARANQPSSGGTSNSGGNPAPSAGSASGGNTPAAGANPVPATPVGTPGANAGRGTEGGGPAPAFVNDVPVSGLAGQAVSAARSQIGTRYVFGTSQPGVSFDCSGLTSWAWRRAGVSIPRTSRAQASALPRVSPGSARPGDLIFFHSPVSHVGIYVGGGQMIHAPYTGSSVRPATVRWGRVTAVGRPG